jgi:hypothetical protein
MKKETVRMVQASANDIVETLFKGEPTTETLLVTAIKNKNREQKAK